MKKEDSADKKAEQTYTIGHHLHSLAGTLVMTLSVLLCTHVMKRKPEGAEAETYSKRRACHPLSTPPVDHDAECQVRGIYQTHGHVDGFVVVLRVLHLGNDWKEC